MKRNKYTAVQRRAFWVFVLPALLLFSTFFIAPLILSIGFSFTNYDGWKTLDYVGLANYKELLTDAQFYSSLKRTFIYALCNIPFKVILPLLAATLVTSKYLKTQTIVRTVFYIPGLLSALVVGTTICWMFGQEYGLINFIIKSLGFNALEWALNTKLATFVISFASNWASLGFYMVIFIGGINSISRDIYEAAEVDGSNGLQSFLKITIPLLAPSIFIVTMLAGVGLLKEYALVQGITSGGPGTSTKYIIQYIYEQGFTQGRYGYASAIGIVVGIIFIAIAVVQFKVSKGGEV